jgi:hypothetical protein
LQQPFTFFAALTTILSYSLIDSIFHQGQVTPAHTAAPIFLSLGGALHLLLTLPLQGKDAFAHRNQSPMQLSLLPLFSIFAFEGASVRNHL